MQIKLYQVRTKEKASEIMVEILIVEVEAKAAKRVVATTVMTS